MKKWTKYHVILLVQVVGIVFLIAFTETKHAGQLCNQIVVDLNDEEDNHFLDEEDVKQLVMNTGKNVIGMNIHRIPFREIEKNMIRDKHIKRVDLYADWKGNLIVSVTLRKPIARIVQQDAPDAYIAEDGVIIPVSDKFTSRVVLVSGEPMKYFLELGSMQEDVESKKIFELIQYMQQDEFWRAQIAQVEVDRKNKVYFYPQVSNVRAEFGYADQLETKFDKLRYFFKEILPVKGWTTYHRVNVEYEQQIIAE